MKMLCKNTSLTIVKFRNSLFIALILPMLFTSNHAVSGWFGYDTREECFIDKTGELMSRWINPLSERDAQRAARLLCSKYPPSKEKNIFSKYKTNQ